MAVSGKFLNLYYSLKNTDKTDEPNIQETLKLVDELRKRIDALEARLKKAYADSLS